MEIIKNPTSYEEKVFNYLLENNLHIAFAESCTGGLAVSRLISVPGASGVINESYVTYSNEAKTRILGVSEKTIEYFGVVSEEVAREMAQGAARISGAEIGIGITGVAGPTAPSDDKPVGMVCYGVYLNGKLDSKTINFGSIERNQLREEAASYIYRALDYLFHRDENA